MTIGILLCHLSPNDLAPETYDYIDRLNRQTVARFIARHGWILAIGNIKGLLRSNTLAGWTARRAVKAFPVWYLDDSPLLRQLNRYFKSQVRRQAKNRPGLWRYGYRRQSGLRRLSDRQSFEAIARRVVPLLRYAIELVPIAERDRQFIYPGDVDWRTWWHREYTESMPGLGLRDFTELAELSFGGVKRREFRQKAVGPVRDVLSVISEFVDLPAIERRLALYALGQFPPPQIQRRLEQIGRYYKRDCFWPMRDPRCLFDKAWSSSYQAKSVTIGMHMPARHTARDGGNVIYLIAPAVRHANLKRTRDAYNSKHESYWNIGGGENTVAELNKKMRLRCSLNIAPETLELRNNMVANIENRFMAVHCDDAEVV